MEDEMIDRCICKGEVGNPRNMIEKEGKEKGKKSKISPPFTLFFQMKTTGDRANSCASCLLYFPRFCGPNAPTFLS
jgi:hypothetical protein